LIGGRVGRGLLLFLLILAAAGAIRVKHFDDSRFMGERQFRSALIARADYLSRTDDVPEWRREVAAVSAQRLGVLEPPVMEALAVAGYRLLGGERPRFPRLLTSLFWLLGGVFVFALARRLTSEHAALYAAAYYLFLPLGVVVSVSFLSDALMLTLFVASIWSLVRYEDDPSAARLLATGALFGACVLVKPLCVFALAGGFIGLRWHSSGFRGLFDRSAIALGLFVLVPTVSYYFYGMYVQGHLAAQAGASFIPALLVQPAFWKDTALTGLSAVGTVPVALALVGLALPANRTLRPLVLGLLAGHLVLILVFTYHVRMAGHYHLPMALPIAIGLGAAVAALVEQVRSAATSPLVRSVCLAGAAVIVAVGSVRAISASFDSAAPTVDRRVARAVGEAVGHSPNVVYVSQFYGMPLEYYGELAGWYWPRAGDYADRALRGSEARQRSVEERLSSLGTVLTSAEPDFRPEYFVVTDFREFAHHEDLAEYMAERCQLVADEPGYLIYGRCRLD